MTPKTKVLKILDKHRDMSLTMGCEVSIMSDTRKYHFVRHSSGFSIVSSDMAEYNYPTHKLTVLGHPATPLTLLKALGEVDQLYYMNVNGKCGTFHKHDHFNPPLTIPLTPRTLNDIPEDDKMWTQLIDVFSL